MNVEIKNVVLLRSERKPYDFNGRKGYSHSVWLLSEGSVVKLKLSEEAYNKIAGKVEVPLRSAKLAITSPADKIKVELLSVEEVSE